MEAAMDLGATPARAFWRVMVPYLMPAIVSGALMAFTLSLDELIITYFTAGPKEARAWTVPVGATAPQAAGVIHTDFEKGFIRAETIAYDDYVRLNGEAGARDAGRLRSEGKEYVVQDGDVMNFRFNV